MSAAAAAHDASFDPARDYDAYEFEWQRTNAPTPNTLRGQIRRFINSGVMKVGAFQRLIGVAAAPYGRFMNGKYKNQWSASQNQTYRAAAYFFYREKKLGKNSVAKMMRKTAPTKVLTPHAARAADRFLLLLCGRHVLTQARCGPPRSPPCRRG